MNNQYFKLLDLFNLSKQSSNKINNLLDPNYIFYNTKTNLNYYFPIVRKIKLVVRFVINLSVIKLDSIFNKLLQNIFILIL